MKRKFFLLRGLYSAEFRPSHARPGSHECACKIAFYNFSACPAPLNIKVYPVSILTLLYVCNRFAVTKLIQFGSTVVHKICISVSLHETKHLQLVTVNWKRIIKGLDDLFRPIFSGYANSFSPYRVAYVVSLNTLVYTKTLKGSSRINLCVHRFTEIRNQSKKVHSEDNQLLKWSRDQNHRGWSGQVTEVTDRDRHMQATVNNNYSFICMTMNTCSVAKAF